MSDYIKRSDAQDMVHLYAITVDKTGTLSSVLRNIIRDIPPADVRPVVLCRDCDYWNEWDHVGRETLGNFRCSCAYWSNEDGPIYYTGGNDFCSYGERREGGTDG